LGTLGLITDHESETLKGEDIRSVRKRLGLTQVPFASILGVHPITVSQWERDQAEPNAWCSGLLDVLTTIDNPKEVGKRAASLLHSAGRARALYELLRHSDVARQVEAYETLTPERK